MTFHLTEEYHLLPFDFCHEAVSINSRKGKELLYPRPYQEEIENLDQHRQVCLLVI